MFKQNLINLRNWLSNDLMALTSLKKVVSRKKFKKSCPINHLISILWSLYWHAYVHCTHLTYLAKIHGRFGWNAKPLTRGDLVSNFVSIFEAYLASLQNFARFKWNQSQITFPDFFREWRVVQTRPTELPLLKYQKSSIIFFLKVNFKITRYFCLTCKVRKKCSAT